MFTGFVDFILFIFLFISLLFIFLFFLKTIKTNMPNDGITIANNKNLYIGREFNSLPVTLKLAQ